MTRSRQLVGIPLAHVLLLGALTELLVFRLAVPALLPSGKGATPGWYSALAHFGLFSFYFTTALAAAFLGLWVVRAAAKAIRASDLARSGGLICVVAVAAVTGLAGAAVVLSPSPTMSFVLQTAFTASVVVLVVSVAVRSRDRGVLIGLGLLVIPFLVHYGGIVIGRLWMRDEDAADFLNVVQSREWSALCLATLLSPYCFAPRPLARSLARPIPLIVALVVAGVGAVVVRNRFAEVRELTGSVIGIDLLSHPPPSSNEVGLYLLALATAAWTLASCLLAETQPRRRVGVGLALLALSGYGFAWPLQFLLAVAGLAVIADVAPGLRDAEAGMPVAQTPPIDDAVWQSYVTALLGGLRRADPHVNALTSRGDAGLVSTIVVSERGGVPVRLRIERLGGAAICLDVICGREIDERRPATFTLWTRPDRLVSRGAHPEPPPSGGPIIIGDEPFDRRFRCRGDRDALERVLDGDARARLAASLDGWIAWWDGQSLRHRLYPGVGAPMDQPIPLSDLATRKAGASAADRLVAVVDLLVEIAARGLPAAADGSGEGAAPAEGATPDTVGA